MTVRKTPVVADGFVDRGTAAMAGVLLVNGGTELSWPVARLVAQAEAAGLPVHYQPAPGRRCPAAGCSSSAVALVADGLACCAACGWTGEELTSRLALPHLAGSLPADLDGVGRLLAVMAAASHGSSDCGRCGR